MGFDRKKVSEEKGKKKDEQYNMKFYVNIYEALDFLIMENLEERIIKEKNAIEYKKIKRKFRNNLVIFINILMYLINKIKKLYKLNFN